MQGVHRVRDSGNLISFDGVWGNLMKDVMPFRQRGHGIAPAGVDGFEGMLLVEQRYRAHLTQSPCPQPESCITQFII